LLCDFCGEEIEPGEESQTFPLALRGLRSGCGVYRHGDSNPGFRRERAAS
jgi:hypothetical protein